MKTIFDRIAQATNTRTQVELADLLGIRQSSISDAKRRKSIPDSWLITLLKQFRLNPDWILTGYGERYLAPLKHGSTENAAIPPEKDTLQQACEVIGLDQVVHLASVLDNARKKYPTVYGHSDAVGALKSEYKEWASQADRVQRPNGFFEDKLLRAETEAWDIIVTALRYIRREYAEWP